MTEYGVQTNNIFDLLNAAEDPAKPAGAAAKPKARRKKSQRGKGGAASGQPQGQAQAAPQPKKGWLEVTNIYLLFFFFFCHTLPSLTCEKYCS